MDRSEYQRAYYLAHRDKKIELARQRRVVNREKVLAQGRTYWSLHRKEISERRRAAYAANPEKRRAVEREKYRSNPAEYARKRREHNRMHPEFKRQSRLRYMYGLTEDDYAKMLEVQGGVCAICGGKPSGCGKSGQRLHVDHDHATGQNRALLCDRCNLGLGKFGDDPVKLHAAGAYLEKWGQS